MRPYIGICDFENRNQVDAMEQVFWKHLPLGVDCVLHVGLMMSYKTLHDLPSKWSDVFPKKENIKNILSSNSDLVYNCLHYADYDNYPLLGTTLYKALSYGGENLHALQLDMPWPSAKEIERALKLYEKPIEIILQVGKKAMDEVGNTPKSVVAHLRDYDGLIQRVLLDKSMGKGLGMDAKALLPFADAISENFPEIGLVAAGGLGPHSLHLVEPLFCKYRNISWDAQGRLRPSGNSLDPIDWKLAEEYLLKSLQLRSR